MSAKDEGGAATVTATVWIGLMGIVACACLLAAAVLVTHRRAQSAADLAALAGAHAQQQGEDPCAAAGQIARRNHARLSACTVLGPDVAVTVTTRGHGVGAQVGAIRARARAGPERIGSGLAPTTYP